MARKRKSPLERSKTFYQRAILKKKGLNEVTLTPSLERSLESFWKAWMLENTGEPSDSLYVTVARLINAHGPSENLYSIYENLCETPRNSLQHFVLLWGDKLGSEKYEQRSKKLSDGLRLNEDEKVSSFLKRKKVKRILGSLEVDERTQKGLNKLLNSQSYRNFEDNEILICDLILHPCDDMEITERYQCVKEEKKSSTKYYYARFGIHAIEKREAYFESQKSIVKKNFKNTVEYWTERGYSENDSGSLVSFFQSQTGTMNKGNLTVRSLDYWLSKGYDIDYARNMVCEVQTRDLEWFLKRYGTEVGCEKFNTMIEKRSRTWSSKDEDEKKKINESRGRTFKQLKESYGYERACEIIKSRMVSVGISSESMDFFNDLDNILPDDVSDKSITGYKADERWVRTECGKLFFLDYVIGNCVIEYNGSFWHADTRDFDSQDFHPVRKQIVETIWKDDHDRYYRLENMGYDVKIVWSNDVMEDRNNVLSDCKNFILKNYRGNDEHER